MAVFGHSEAGKTSFIERLLDKSYTRKPNQSTEGVETHLIKSKFDSKNKATKLWTEVKRDTSELMKDFSDVALSRSRWVPEYGASENTEASHPSHPIVIEDSGNKDTSLTETSKTDKEDIDEEEEKIEMKEMKIGDKEVDGTGGPKVDDETLVFLHRSAHDIPYSINLWDHGGQNEFMVTHHLFLKAEALILIVMDISLDLHIPLKQSNEERKKVGNPKTPAQILKYWLNSVYVQAAKRNLKPNIALVLTHTDLIIAEKPSQYIETYIKDIRDTVEGKPYAAYIAKENIFLVDNKRGSKHRFNDVRRELFDKISKQPTWGMERPLRWLKLEADVLQKANYEGQPYLHISKVNELASALVIYDHEVESFLKFHHVLGDLIYYKEPKLKDFIITNPQ